MKKLLVAILMSFVLMGCDSIIKSGAISEENRINIASLKVGMSSHQVIRVMGGPNKSEQRNYENKTYTIWYYITQPPILGQSRLVSSNYTPLVFKSDKLIGWGKKFYRYTFNIDEERQKISEEERQAYTDDKDEWPRNEHALIPVIDSTQNSEINNSIKEPVKQEIQNEDVNEQEILKHDQMIKEESTQKNPDVSGSLDQKINSEEVKDKSKDAKMEGVQNNCKTKSVNDEAEELKYNLWE